jgi:uroporphyrinogen-III synthase
MTLAGRRILVTRGEEQGEAFCALIRDRGGVPVLFPTIRLVPPDDPRPLEDAVSRLSSFDWIVFASANAVRFFCERAAGAGIAAPPAGVRVACVGPGTGRELARRRYPVHLTAEVHTAAGLLGALRREGIAGKRFLVPRAQEGRETLVAGIAGEGGTAEAVVAYANGLPERDERAAREVVSAPPDVCTFASPSAFRNFFRLVGEREALGVLLKSRIAVIGEVTAQAVAERNFTVDIMPEKYTLEGMLDAIEARFAAERTGGGRTR